MSQQNKRANGKRRLTGLGIVVLVLLGAIIAGTVLFVQHNTSKTATTANGNSVKKTKSITKVNSSYSDLKIPAGLTELSRSSSNPTAADQPNTTVAYSINQGAAVTLDSLIKDFESQGYHAGSKTVTEEGQSVTLTPSTSQNKLELIVSISPKNIVFVRAQEYKRTDT